MSPSVSTHLTRSASNPDLSEDGAAICEDAVAVYNQSDTGKKLDGEAKASGFDSDFKVTCFDGPIDDSGAKGLDGNSEGYTPTAPGGTGVQVSISNAAIGLSHEKGPAATLAVEERMAVTLAHERGHLTDGEGHSPGNPKPEENATTMTKELVNKRLNSRRDPFVPLKK